MGYEISGCWCTKVVKHIHLISIEKKFQLFCSASRKSYISEVFFTCGQPTL